MRPQILQITQRPLTHVKFNLEGDFFVVCGKDGEVALIRTENCECVGTYIPNDNKPGSINAVDITYHCTMVATANMIGRVVLYHFTGEQHSVISCGGYVRYVEFNGDPSDQNKVVICNDSAKESGVHVPARICIYQIEPKEKLLNIEKNLPLKATKVKWGAFDETLVSIFEEGQMIIWDAENGDQLQVIQAHNGPLTSLQFNDDKLLMITSSKDMTAKLWAMDELECIKTYKSDRPLNDAGISPLYKSKTDPKYHVILAGGQAAQEVTTSKSDAGKFEACLFHMIFEEEIGQARTGFGPVNTLAWFPDGRGFVTAGEDGFVRIYPFDSEYFTSKKYD